MGSYIATYDIVEGTTNNLVFQLLESGAAINLTSATVVLLLEDRKGTTISSPGTITITDATNGKVQLAPTDGTIFVATNGPYYARWKITDQIGKISFVPTGTRDVWNIVGV